MELTGRIRGGIAFYGGDREYLTKRHGSIKGT